MTTHNHWLLQAKIKDQNHDLAYNIEILKGILHKNLTSKIDDPALSRIQVSTLFNNTKRDYNRFIISSIVIDSATSNEPNLYYL